MLTTRHGEHFEIEKLKDYGRVFDFIIITPLLMIVVTALRLAKLAMLIPPKRVYEAWWCHKDSVILSTCDLRYEVWRDRLKFEEDEYDSLVFSNSHLSLLFEEVLCFILYLYFRRFPWRFKIPNDYLSTL